MPLESPITSFTRDVQGRHLCNMIHEEHDPDRRWGNDAADRSVGEDAIAADFARPWLL